MLKITLFGLFVLIFFFKLSILESITLGTVKFFNRHSPEYLHSQKQRVGLYETQINPRNEGLFKGDMRELQYNPETIIPSSSILNQLPKTEKKISFIAESANTIQTPVNTVPLTKPNSVGTVITTPSSALTPVIPGTGQQPIVTLPNTVLSSPAIIQPGSGPILNLPVSSNVPSPSIQGVPVPVIGSNSGALPINVPVITTSTNSSAVPSSVAVISSVPTPTASEPIPVSSPTTAVNVTTGATLPSSVVSSGTVISGSIGSTNAITKQQTAVTPLQGVPANTNEKELKDMQDKIKDEPKIITAGEVLALGKIEEALHLIEKDSFNAGKDEAKAEILASQKEQKKMRDILNNSQMNIPYIFVFIINSWIVYIL